MGGWKRRGDAVYPGPVYILHSCLRQARVRFIEIDIIHSAVEVSLLPHSGRRTCDVSLGIDNSDEPCLLSRWQAEGRDRSLHAHCSETWRIALRWCFRSVTQREYLYPLGHDGPRFEARWPGT